MIILQRLILLFCFLLPVYPTVALSEETLPDNVKEQLFKDAEIALSCRKVEYPESFFQKIDINNDAKIDYILDFNDGITCDGKNSSLGMCGSIGCAKYVYVSDESGNYKKVLDQMGYGIKFYKKNNSIMVKINSGGINCPGGDNNFKLGKCNDIYIWNGKEFVEKIK